MNESGVYDCPMAGTFREKLDVVFPLAWLFYLGFVSRVIFGPLMPQIQRDLGLSNVQSGNLFFMITLGYLLANMCSGLIAAKIEHLGALRLSAWLLGLALAPLVFVDTFWGLGVTLMLIGFSGALHLPSALATLTAEIERFDWGKGFGVHQCAPPLAFVTSPLIAAGLLHWWSWRTILVGWALLSLLSALAYTLWGEGGRFPGRAISPLVMKDLAIRPSFWFITILLAMGMAGNAGIFAILPLYFVAERGFELASANTLIGFSQLSGILAVFFAGMAADRIGPQRFMGLTLGCTAVLTICIGWGSGWIVLLALFLQPAVLTAFFPAAFAALARVAPPSMRSVTSAVGPPLAFLLGAGGIPVAIGHLADWTSFAFGIMVTGVLMLAVVPLVFLLRLGDYDSQPGC
ncbi:MAG: MFS transporter [Desulfopila sp.]